MSDASQPQVAIVDYGLGNLFSVKHACEHAGLRASITAKPDEVLAASAVILPGVGAYGDAMDQLHQLDLIGSLQEIAASGKPLLGICLGMQLLMTESHEFGRHRGLNIIDGEVVRLQESDGARRLKVPHIGWNRVSASPSSEAGWNGTLLNGLPDGVFMYFVHSFYPRPGDSSLVLAHTRYGPIEFCSSLRLGNVFGCQFHPERSGPPGLQVYRNLAATLQTSAWEHRDAGKAAGHVGKAGGQVRTA